MYVQSESCLTRLASGRTVSCMTSARTLLTTSEVAEELQVHPETVRVWMRDGLLKAIKLPGRRGFLRVRRADLDAFLENGRKRGAA